MTTKLEAMVGLLAGREVEPKLLEELADPSSEASRFLEATRARSKALLAGPLAAEALRVKGEGRGRWTIALVLLVVSALVAVAAAVHAVDRRVRELEAASEARRDEAKAEALRLEAILGRLADSANSATLDATLRRIDSRLARLEAAPVSPPKADRAIALTLEELAAIRRELAALDKQSADRSEDLQAAVHDAGRVLRLLLSRIEPTPAELEKNPVFPPGRPQPGGEPRRPRP
jgi:hypothetical protein